MQSEIETRALPTQRGKTVAARTAFGMRSVDAAAAGTCSQRRQRRGQPAMGATTVPTGRPGIIGFESRGRKTGFAHAAWRLPGWCCG